MNKILKLACCGILLIAFLCCGCSSHLYHPQNTQELYALLYDTNINLGDIDTSKITDMSELFKYSGRDGFSGIETWDTSNVQDMSRMFEGANNFNQDIGSWDVSNVQNISSMFYEARNFNQDISRWNTSNVRYMVGVFHGAASFNQDISSWDARNLQCKDPNTSRIVIVDITDIFTSSPLESNPPLWYKQYLERCRQQRKNDE